MNKIIEALRKGMVQKLIIGQAASQGEIMAGMSRLIPVDIHTNKLLLKSVEVTCSKGIEFRVEFFEEANMSNSRYNSGIVSRENYDVLDLPYVDKEEQNMMYFNITNESDFDAEFTIEVRGVEMK